MDEVKVVKGLGRFGKKALVLGGVVVSGLALAALLALKGRSGDSEGFVGDDVDVEVDVEVSE